ncbi:MAG: glycosyltransferase [Phycisphaerae bacterium]|nr:glycosyltransferase [Phycisphaerae bacterium]
MANCESNLTVVIPAYNESENLQNILPETIRHCKQKGYDLIVVDDGSKDATLYVLEQFLDEECLEVVRHKKKPRIWWCN